MNIGDPMPAPEVTVIEGALLDGDTIEVRSYEAIDGNGQGVEIGTAGEYAISADAVIAGRPEFYEFAVRPGRLVVREAPQVAPPDEGDDSDDNDSTGDDSGENNPPDNGSNENDNGSGENDSTNDGSDDGPSAEGPVTVPDDGDAEDGVENDGIVEDNSSDDDSSKGDESVVDGAGDGSSNSGDVAGSNGAVSDGNHLPFTGSDMRWAWGAVALCAITGAIVMMIRRRVALSMKRYDR